MARIIIKNIGPIKSVDINLNKVNVFIGPQSSGKSTIAKIVSFCSWVEKNVILKTQPEIKFYDRLMEYHNLESKYFNDQSYIEYISDHCKIIWSGNDVDNTKISVTLNQEKGMFRNRKIIYIPAERNFVTIPGLGKYNERRDNILGFLYDWFEAKQSYIGDSLFKLPLSSISDVTYHYNKENDMDYIKLDNGIEIRLRHASSGIMSVTPLLVVFEYMNKILYTKERIESPFETINIKSKLKYINDTSRENFEKLINELQDIENQLDETQGELRGRVYNWQKKLNAAIGIDSDYSFTETIIEEPESNLFPSTQKDLMYYLVHSINDSQRDHQLILTTHSPFVLFALNNCMMGGLVGSKIPSETKEDFQSMPSWIDPKKVSVYEVYDGELRRIQDEDGIIGDNYLNQAYKENSREYLQLLNYYDDEE